VVEVDGCRVYRPDSLSVTGRGVVGDLQMLEVGWHWWGGIVTLVLKAALTQTSNRATEQSSNGIQTELKSCSFI
jgi:hypothetical protein